MLATEEINFNNLDKPHWQSFRFEEIARSIAERVDPKNTNIDTYVGLEHLDSDSLHIHRSGTPSDVKGQKLKCYPGDVIFGKRRAYQRKAAIVTTEAICSAHAMVLRANPEIIDPKLFPFFLHSDEFMHRAIDISVGSLSPTINWKTLREQEFLLPPKEQQAEIAELLWAMDEVIEKESSLLELNSRLKETYLKKMFHEAPRTKSIGELFDARSGYPYKSILFNKDGRGTKLMRGINIKENRFYWDAQIDRFYDHADGNEEKFRVKNGDVLVPMDGSKLGLNFARVTKKEAGTLLVQRIALLRADNEIFADLLVAYLSSRYFRAFISQNNTTTAIPHISLNQLKSIKLPSLTIELEHSLNTVTNLYKLYEQSKEKFETSKSLQKSLINQIF